MQLKILSLKGVQYSGEVESINAKTKTGEITVLENHRPLISILQKGQIRIIDSSHQSQEFPVTSGFLEVRPGNQVSVIVE